jgi:hypothetical protein
MRRIIDVHKELLGLIEIRDAAGARKLMDDHVKMIRARRVSEHGKPSQPSFRDGAKRRTRNSDASTVQGSGFRIRSFGPSRNDEGEGRCC